MALQTPIEIRKALKHIAQHDYALPAIQREFVWPPEKICALFDSLLRGYPIGSFLFWTVEPTNSREFKFYDFVRHYHKRDNPHCQPLEIMDARPLTAVLDGQQRLTAFNIALRGSMAVKEPRKWWTNPDAFPKRRLCLNLAREADENEAGLRYDFKFLTEERAAERTDGELWFPVWQIMDFKNAGPDINAYLNEHGLAGSVHAFNLLHELYMVVNVKPTISFFLEEEQDLDKVLNIFIRVNSGATPLSYSDLLMSIATAAWTDLDAREAIHELVDDLNDTRDGFAISKDFVLKAGLMLADISSVGFKVTNFKAKNMAILESNWRAIAKALHLAVRLASEFGFSGQTLSADSALLPIAYSLHQRGLDESYLTASKWRDDREAIKGWLIRSLLKSGIWGSGLDTTLTSLREVLKAHGAERFPVAEIEAEMARRGRGLRFTEEEVEDLVEIAYGDRRCFPLLALLFPFVDLRNEFHIDHIFPRSRFDKRRLTAAGMSAEQVELARERRDFLPNLQLLQDRLNQSKGNKMPAEWLIVEFPDERARSENMARHELGDVPPGFEGFDAFYQQRRERLKQRIRDVLGVKESVVTA